MSNNMIEDKLNSLTNFSAFPKIKIVGHGICDYDLRKDIKIVV